MNSYSWILRVRPAFLAALLKRVAFVRRRMVATPFGGFFVDPVSNFAAALTSPAGYEPNMVAALHKVLRPGGTFIDIGANEGFFSVVAAKLVGPRGRVVAVEPQTRLQDVIFRNLQANNISNTEVIQRVVTNRDGFDVLHLSPDTNTGSSGLARATRYKNPVQLVPCSTLEHLISSCGFLSVDLVKMDVEGFEHEAVLGSKSVFQRGIVRNLALELHPEFLRRRQKSENEIVGFLEECGYRRRGDCGTLVLTRE